MLVAMVWGFLGGQERAEEGFAIYNGNADFIGTPSLILADVSGILPKGTEAGMVPSFVHRWDFFIQCFN